MKRHSWSLAAIGVLCLGPAGCMKIMDFQTEKPMVIMIPAAPSPIGLAFVKDVTSRPSRTELASFAAG
jgi:hypothetical protein